MPKCLVCSKEVMPDTPGLAGVHKGETIYFCSNVCKAEYKKYANMRETSSSPPR